MGEKKYRYVRYPVKLGFSDGSGKDENEITDAGDGVVVHVWGDCCKVGGIQDDNIGKMLVNLLNTHRPKFRVSYWGPE